jgi:hypothetical protein
MPVVREMTLGDHLQRVLDGKARIGQRAEELSAFMAANTTSSIDITSMAAECQVVMSWMNEAKNRTGMQQYVKDQFADQTKDFAAQATTFVQKLTDYINTIYTTYPTDTGAPGGWILERKMAADGSISTRNFAPANTATIRAKLDAIVAAG